jgi:hypothetical protein
MTTETLPTLPSPLPKMPAPTPGSSLADSAALCSVRQILVLTFPLIGNYGVPDDGVKDEWGMPKYFESNEIQVSNTHPQPRHGAPRATPTAPLTRFRSP